MDEKSVVVVHWWKNKHPEKIKPQIASLLGEYTCIIDILLWREKNTSRHQLQEVAMN